jgi:hypothetical protein
VAATRPLPVALQQLGALAGGVLAAGPAKAVDLPANKAEALISFYDGGGVEATGPALLVRKNLLDKVSLSASYSVDMVTNASIDVVTTASPFKENRKSWDLGADYVVRDAMVSLSYYQSDEPDYVVTGVGLGVSQEVFGGMTTVTAGFARNSDQVLKKNSPEFSDRVLHWQYRAGLTQILTPRWLASVNFEAISDSGYLGSPYRVARVFGAAVPERNPRTRTSRAVKLGTIGDIGGGQSVRGEYRYFWDTWAIKAHTLEGGYSRRFGEDWIADGFVRWYSQDAAIFYSDNAQSETTYISRNRQLSTYTTLGFGVKGEYVYRRVPGQYEIRLHGAWEFVQFKHKDFTDVRTGQPYKYEANMLRLWVSASF